MFMTDTTQTSQERPVATAVLLERRRLLQLWEAVRRSDGTYDRQRLDEFGELLRAGMDAMSTPYNHRRYSGEERRRDERREP